ncbi:hypothetical protein LCGC14_2501320, partial [marine sediment metagenome]
EKYNLFEQKHWVTNTMSAAPAFGISMHEGIAAFRIAKRDGMKYPEAYHTGAMALVEAYKKNMPPDSKSEVAQDDKRSAQNALRIFTGHCEHYEPMGLKYPYVEVPFAMLLGQISLPPKITSTPPHPDSPLNVGVTSLEMRTVDVIYVGIIDAIIEWQAVQFVNDIKTTAWILNQNWLDGFQMDQGMIGYTVAARELLGIDTSRALIHGIWVSAPAKTAKGKKLDDYFHTKELYWDESQLNEWRQNTLNTIQDIEMRKQDGKWSMAYNEACNSFGMCPYRPVCSSPPGAREQLLTMDFHKAIWTPLEDERLQKIED